MSDLYGALAQIADDLDVQASIAARPGQMETLERLAQRIRELARPEVLALPPEPPVGATVEINAGTYGGRTYECMSGDGGGEEYPPLWMDRRFKACMSWADLLRIAGPAGVRVIADGAT